MTPDGPSDAAIDRAMQLIESERAQVGHEIHDGLLPLIFAASATVSSILDQSGRAPSHPSDRQASDQQASDRQASGSLPGGEAEPSPDTLHKLEQVAQWLHDAMQVGRRLLTQVYPPELIGTVWVKAAKDTIGRLFAESDANIDWNVDPRVNETSSAVALAAYRITVEAVRNALAHGKASEVVIDAEMNGDAIKVRIVDNGAGFDPSELPQDRYGIRSMKGRAGLVGGRAQVDSQPGGPTTITFLSNENGE